MLQATSLFKNIALKSRFHTRAQPLLKATIMEMPAMSPTMTEGGIVEWKVKAGEAFSSGDILLEVETDKATIDVEALDDGVMGKIVIDNGAKGIKVGSPIAVLAEPEDDLSTLDFDGLLSSKKAPAAKEAEKIPEPVKKEDPKPVQVKKEASKPAQVKKEASKTAKVDGIFSKANPKQTLYPSVSQLLHANHISEAKALEDIPASGPNGRLLKGDVLLYLNKIDKDNYIKLNQYLQKTSVLDLSNIQLRQPKVAEKKVVLEPVVLSTNITLETEELTGSYDFIEQVVSQKLKQLQTQVHQSKPQKSVYYDAIFEDLISTRYSQPTFNYKFTLNAVDSGFTPSSKIDLFDELFSTSAAKKVQQSLDEPVSEKFALQVTIDLGTSPKTDALTKAKAFISKINNLNL